MNKQYSKFSNLIGTFFLLMILCWISSEVQAQVTLTTQTDLTIPSGKDYLYVELRGGDGGKDGGSAQGGQGASINGFLKIGSGDKQIAAGGTLRFIPGEAGKTKPDFCGGGGGGTGLAYKGPNSNTWTILAVAGGGGGGGIGDYYEHEHGMEQAKVNGNPANTNHNGNGPGQSLKEDTKDGKTITMNGLAGGGAFSGTGLTGGGKRGMKSGTTPYTAPGGSGCSGCVADGGDGFGSGGAGYSYKYSIKNQHVGGGGGGYSGGDGGYSPLIAENKRTSNGGGSYYNTNYFSTVTRRKNGTTNSPQDGYITYEYVEMALIAFKSKGNKCLTVDGGKTANGTNILTNDCVDAPRQQWAFFSSDQSIRLIKNMSKCLDLTGDSDANQTNIQLSDCQGGPGQRWLYNGIDKKIRLSRNLSKCLDATTGMYTPYQDVNVQINDCGSIYAPQYWEIESLSVSNPSAVKNIVPVKSTYSNTRALQSISGAKWKSNIQLGAKSSTDNSIRWVFDGLQIKYGPSKDLCLGLADNSTTKGTNVQVMISSGGQETKQWIYDGNTKQIRSFADPEKCIEVETNGLYKVGSNLKLMDCDDHLRQQFNIVDK